MLFVAAATVRLDGQGPQYDELHQATGAFVHLGRTCPLFCTATVGGYPLLNMPYSAAVKTHALGLWLRWVDPRFDLDVWRLGGVLLTAASVALLGAAVAPTLGPAATAVLLALIVSDVNLLLHVRHDFGPVALALVLRLALLGIWLWSERAGSPSRASSWAIGLLAGIATVEKLSSVVLVAPALLLVAARGRDAAGRRHLATGIAGLATGLLPLALLNGASLLARGELVSLRMTGHGSDAILPTGRELFAQLGLGQGADVRETILAAASDPRLVSAEAAVVATGLGLVAALALARPHERRLRLAGLAVACWALVVGGLAALPRPTAPHHWILATPLPALAVVLALRGALEARRRIAATALAVVALALLALRAPALASTVTALRAGTTALAWDPSLAALGRLAAAEADRAYFAATSWGVATQIHCLSHGRAPVRELFWPSRAGDDPALLVAAAGRRTLYVVRLRDPAVPALDFALGDVLATDPRWQEVPPPAASRGWRAVELRAFVRRAVEAPAP